MTRRCVDGLTVDEEVTDMMVLLLTLLPVPGYKHFLAPLGYSGI